MMTDIEELRQHFAILKEQRSSWEPLWKDIRDYILPDFGAFEGEDAWEGGKRYRRVYDTEATNCADVLAAGLLGGVSSPSRPWLRLTTLDQELDASSDVKEWLSIVQRQMLQIYAKADIYTALHQSYLELPVFGQACSILKPHPTRTVSLQNLTIGEYYFSEDPYGQVDTLYRRLSMTAKQIVQMWGVDKVSTVVKTMLDTNPFQRFNVIHAIEPRLDRDISKRDNLNMPWKSVYFEEESGTILSESGFRQFPAMCPRWMTAGSSQYGRGPGAKALSSAKALQRMEMRLATLVDYLSDPPVCYPTNFVGELKQFRPGGRIPADPQQGVAIRSAWEVKTDPASLQALINERKAQIQKLFYVNVFQMIASSAGADRTATEVAALEQEKVMMLGPVLERIHGEFLDPLVSNTFAMMIENDSVPPPPEELQGRPLSVEYISVLAEQQKNSSVNGILKLTQEIGVLAQLNPNALDKLDTDAAIDALADMNGVPPSMIVSGQKVAMIRQARAEQQAAMQQQQAAAQLAQNIHNISPVLDNPSARQVMSNIQAGEEGYSGQ